MSIWTSSPKFLVAALMGAAISGVCAPAIAAIDHDNIRTSPLPTQIPVANDAVVISAPAGFCIDRLSSVTETRDAFVLLVPCTSATGSAHAREPSQPGLLTASVLGRASSGDLPGVEHLDAYFASPLGRAVLSRTGDPEALTISETYADGDVFFVHVIEGNAVGALGAHSWRAFFEVNGCMVTATLRDLDGFPMTSVGAFGVVERFVDGIVAASPH